MVTNKFNYAAGYFNFDSSFQEKRKRLPQLGNIDTV